MVERSRREIVAAIRAPLFVPADRPDRFVKAAASGADAVILDLEDAVAADAKDAARAALAADFTDLPVIVRINAAGTSWHEADVEAVRKLPVAAVMLPKAEDPAALAAVSAGLGGDVALIALIESARGVARVREIAETPGVARLAFGSVDFCADLGCAHLREVLLPIRLQLVLASRLAAIAAPVDGVTVQLGDPAIAHDDAAHARALGFTGKLCIHPKQIAEVKRAFAPAADEIAWARQVLASGDGAVSVDGAMVDEPVRIRARTIIAQAGQTESGTNRR
ncbi:MAG: HpcH/HpaI aldolase/citrate lyase family protein [Pseudochelatococcus sp.]|jgi:citrate lyase subunit beta/citryl-CoA lyase|uniref:HpcH/HpaI aldolase/citrate lyase family protein n=1 Tax=Pseudochelatococcus sp. TaxID=2020869 RepID=UPI003D8E900F